MEKNETLYQENLKLFKRFGSRYLDQVKSAESSVYHFSKTEKGELNLRNTKKEFDYHSNRGALNEAVHAFQETENIEHTQVLFVFGIGLGYFYDAAQKWLKGKKNRYLVFFEDDFCVIQKFLETEKAKEILSDLQVILFPFLIQDEKKWEELPIEFVTCGKLFAKTPSQSTQSRVYQKQRGGIATLVRLKLYFAIEQESAGFQLMDEAAQELTFNNLYSGIAYLSRSYLGKGLKGKFKGIPAMICGAGPSIGKGMETIRSIKDRCLLFGAGTGMNVLNKSGILPHFGGALDPYETSLSRIMTNTAFEVPYCYTHRFHHEAFKNIHGTKILFRTLTYFKVEDWFNQQLGIKGNVEVPAKISTTNYCLYLAKEMGCYPIALAGIDLAYTDSSRYPKEVKEHPLDPESFKKEIGSLPYESGRLIPMKNSNGEPILTRWDWMTEAHTYTEFATSHPETELTNVSQGGLPIEALPNPTPEVFKEKSLQNSFDLLNLVHANIHESGTVDVTARQVREALTLWKESLEEAKGQLERMGERFSSIRKEVLDSDVIPESVFDEDALNSLKELSCYEYYLADMDQMFYEMTLLEMHRFYHFPESYTEKRKCLKELEYEETKTKFLLSGVKLHLELVEKALKIDVPENGSPASPPSRNTKEVYQEESGKITIKDPEMGLDLSFPLDDENKPSRFYSPGGKLLAEGWFVNGKRAGKNWQYYSSGALFSLLRFREGKLHGQQQYFYEDGTPKSILSYQDDKLHGTVQLFYCTGKNYREVSFQDGKMDGIEKIWNAQGVLVSEAEFHMNEPVGKSRKWHSNGQLAKEVVYYGSSEKYDLHEWNTKGELIRQKWHIPDPLGEEVQKDSESRKESMRRVREQLESLRKKESNE